MRLILDTNVVIYLQVLGAFEGIPIVNAAQALAILEMAPN